MPGIINDSIMDSVLGCRGRRTLVSLCIFFDCLKKRAYDLLTKIARSRPPPPSKSAMVNSDLLAAKRQPARDRVRLPINYLQLFAHVHEGIAYLPHVNGLNLSHGILITSATFTFSKCTLCF